MTRAIASDRAITSGRAIASDRFTIPQRQNLLLWSEDFGNAAWFKNVGVSVISNTLEVTDPNGGNTASRVRYDGSGVVDDIRFYQVGGTTTGPGEWSCISVWLRVLAGTHTIALVDNASLGSSAPFVLNTTWTRYTYAAQSAGSPYAQLLAVTDRSGTNAAFTFYAWGGQLVRANWPGNYVQTAAAAVNSGPIRNTP